MMTAYTTSAIQSAYDGLAPAAGFAQVIGSDANTWYVTFSGAAGINQPLSGMVTANASQLAQDVSVSDLLSGRFGNTPGATGFTGLIQNMSNITCGGGLNLLLGSNVALYEALLSKNASVSSQNSLFGDVSFSPGRNVFEVGGNALSGFFTDGRTGDGRYDGNNTQDVFRFLTVTLSSTFINGQLSFGEPVLAPGVHLMSGMIGGDTDKFSGFWGVAAVIEPPSVYAGLDLNFGFDTLDFNTVNSDLTFDIYTLTTDNISGWQERLNALGHPMPLSLGMNLVLARNNAGTKLIEQFGDLLGSTISFGEFELTYVPATGIENIIGGSGRNTFKFHGAARIDGFLSANPSGSISLDYSDHDSAGDSVADVTVNGQTCDRIVVDGTAGLNYGIPGLASPLPVLGTFPGINVIWGSATGVLGSRLDGLDLWAPSSALGSFAPANNAVNAFDNLVESPLRDQLKGNDRKNTFTLGQGGSDAVDGGAGTDTASFAGSSSGMVINLATGTAHTGLTTGSVTFAAHTTLSFAGNHGSLAPTHSGQTATILAASLTATGIQAALEGLSTLNPGDIAVVQLSSSEFDIRFYNSTVSTTITVDAGNLVTRSAGTSSYTHDTVNGQNVLQFTENSGTLSLTHQATASA